MNKPMLSCLWQATLRLKASVITTFTSDDHILILLGYDFEGESYVDC
ncbi:hypothetical protein LCE44_27515 [Vibrio harveyi]|nr:hypothetical protein [Vibrio harveyi]EKO3821485.1 hypothetical protein [Vibrio harveyi]ELH7813069.1 hypothetical protein [Vibrio harveyi]MDF5088394.1 hypothetical protein [Vibrio parahaemolyticus]HDM8072325.1 hypothetical protein [Vibrio harveyi]